MPAQTVYGVDDMHGRIGRISFFGAIFLNGCIRLERSCPLSGSLAEIEQKRFGILTEILELVIFVAAPSQPSTVAAENQTVIVIGPTSLATARISV